MAKTVIIGAGVALAAVGVVWAWRERGAVERDLTAVAKRIAPEVKGVIESAHKRIDGLEARVKDEVLTEINLAHNGVAARRREIVALEKRVKDLAAHVHGQRADCAEDQPRGEG